MWNKEFIPALLLYRVCLTKFEINGTELWQLGLYVCDKRPPYETTSFKMSESMTSFKMYFFIRRGLLTNTTVISEKINGLTFCFIKMKLFNFILKKVSVDFRLNADHKYWSPSWWSRVTPIHLPSKWLLLVCVSTHKNNIVIDFPGFPSLRLAWRI